MLAAIAIIAAVQIAAGPCGDQWICPSGGNQVCGVDRAGKLTSRKNLCEAVCNDEEIERQGECLSDILVKHQACKAQGEDQTKCEAKAGCRFDDLFKIVDEVVFAPAGVQCGVHSGNVTQCNAKRDSDGNRMCAAVVRTSSNGNTNECIEYEICASMSAKGQTACKQVVDGDGNRICKVENADQGKCVTDNRAAMLLPDLKDEKSCTDNSDTKWISFFKCSEKGNGGPGDEEAENDESQEEDGSLETQCENAGSPDECKKVLNDKTGAKACDLTVLDGSNGECGADPEEIKFSDENYMKINSGCMNYTEAGKAECNAVDDCAFQVFEQSGGFKCSLHDACGDLKSEFTCSGVCKWLEDEELCFTDPNAAEDSDTKDDEENVCEQIKDKSNCDNKKGDNGDNICLFKIYSEGLCAKEGTDNECSCDDADACDGKADYQENADSCNAISSDDGDDNCVFDTSKKKGGCTELQCYDHATKGVCEDFAACGWNADTNPAHCFAKDENQEADDPNAEDFTEDDETPVDRADDDAGVDCTDFSGPDVIDEKCTTENECTITTRTQEVCTGAEGSSDKVNSICESVLTYLDFDSREDKCIRDGGDKLKAAELGSDACVFVVRKLRTCTDGLSCATGDASRDDCDSILKDGEAYCLWEETDEFENANGDTVDGLCRSKSSQAEAIPGKCGLNQNFVSPTYPSDNVDCGELNVTVPEDVKLCNRLRTGEGYKQCDYIDEIVVPGTCQATNEQVTCPDITDASVTNKKDHCEDESKGLCYYADSECQCAKAKNVKGKIPNTEFQCELAREPAAGQCTWVSNGVCGCDAPDELDGGVDAYDLDKKDCAKTPEAAACTWYPEAACAPKSDLCGMVKSKAECNGEVAEDHGCLWSDPVKWNECVDYEPNQKELCSRFSDKSACADQDGCAMMSTKDTVKAEIAVLAEEGLQAGSGVGFSDEEGAAEIFLECYELDSQDKCEAPQFPQANALCMSKNTSATSDLSCMKGKQCDTDTCEAKTLGMCTYGLSSYKECFSDDDEQCSTRDEGNCVDREGCQLRVVEEVNCIPKDPCQDRVTFGKDICEAVTNCNFKGVDEAIGLCFPKGATPDDLSGDDGGEDVLAGEGELGDTAGKAGKGNSSSSSSDDDDEPDSALQLKCSVLEKGSCDKSEECDWVIDSDSDDKEQGKAICYFEKAEVDTGPAKPGDAKNDDLLTSKPLNLKQLDCFQYTQNKSTCEGVSAEECVPVLRASSVKSCNQAFASGNHIKCYQAGCDVVDRQVCKFYVPVQSRKCVPLAGADEEEAAEACGINLESAICAAQKSETTGEALCDVEVEYGQNQCVPFNQQTEEDEQEEATSQQEDDADCSQNPEECCNNAEGKPACNDMKDDDGNAYCNYVEGDDQSYCGGVLCNETLILGIAKPEQCNAIDGCQWFEEKAVDMCVYLDKCKYKDAEECAKLDGCQMADKDDNSPSKGDDLKEGEDIQTLCRTDYANVKNGNECNVSQSVASNEQLCNEREFCVWDGSDNEDEIESIAQDSGCKAVSKENEDNTENADGTPGKNQGGGGGAGEIGGAEEKFRECKEYSDRARCRGWLKNGEPRCSWYVTQQDGRAFTYCINYNKCAVKGKAQCLANDCDFYEEFRDGELVGHCRHPPSRFSEGNKTCVPFEQSSAGDIDQLFFGKDIEFLRTTTTVVTTRKTTKRPKKTTKATTKTTTTRTTQQELPDTKEDEFVAPIVDEDGTIKVTDVPVIEEEEEKFDYGNYALDMTWAPLVYYDELYDVQIQKITVDVESLLQYRLTNLGVSPIKIHFVIPYADKTGGRRHSRDARLYKQLTVRVTFRKGMLAKQVNELVHGIVVKPLEIRIPGRTGTYTTAIVNLVRDSGPNRKEMYFPELASEVIEDNTAITDSNGDAMSETEVVDAIKEMEAEVAAAEQARLEQLAKELSETAGAQVTAADVEAMSDLEIGDIADGLGDMDIAANALAACKKANNGDASVCKAEAKELEALTLAARTKVLEFSDQGSDTEAEEEYNNTTTIVAAVVIIILVILMIVFLGVYYVRKHKAFDDVYGTAGSRAVYGNPVYGGAPGAGGDGYLDVGKSFEYPKTQTAEVKKKGLIRQESLC